MTTPDRAAGLGEPARNTVRIFRTHTPDGVPVPAEFVRVIHHRSVRSVGSDTMDFLRALNPTQTDQTGVFAYTDPANGSGWLRLERFRPADATRIQELVRMEEITRVVGAEPLRPADLSIGNAMVMRTNNPWVMLGIALVMIVGGIATLTAVPRVPSTTGELVALIVVGVLLIGVGVAAVIVGAIRLPWWRRARRYAREAGDAIPPDLSGL